MKYFVKKSVLLLLVVLAFCACDNSNDNGEVIQPNPHPQSLKTVVNYTGEVEFVVDAPQIREDIEQDLKANPPFGGSKKYQFIIKSHSTLPAFMLYAVNPEDDKSADGYILDIAGRVESNDNYRLFPAASANAWYKMDIVPVDTKDGKPVATYDVFMHQDIPSSLVHSKMYFCEDLTAAEYRQKFPNEDIHAVVRRLVLSYVSVGDIIKE